ESPTRLCSTGWPGRSSVLRSALPTLRQRPASVSRWTTAARAYNWQPLNQQPRQIDTIILLTFASSRSMTGSVPSGGPLMGGAVPDDESAVPRELVPGAVGLVPEAPPVEAWCDPMPPPRANAAGTERLTHR